MNKKDLFFNKKWLLVLLILVSGQCDFLFTATQSPAVHGASDAGPDATDQESSSTSTITTIDSDNNNDNNASDSESSPAQQQPTDPAQQTQNQGLYARVTAFVLPQESTPTPEQYLEAIIHVATIPAEIIPSYITDKKNLHSALMLRDILRLIGNGLSMRNGKISEFNLSWALYDSYSLAQLINKKTQDLQLVKVPRGHAALSALESSLRAYAALRERQGTDHQALVACATLARLTDLYLARLSDKHASAGKNALVAAALVTVYLLCRIYYDEAAKQREIVHALHVANQELVTRYNENMQRFEAGQAQQGPMQLVGQELGAVNNLREQGLAGIVGRVDQIAPQFLNDQDLQAYNQVRQHPERLTNAALAAGRQYIQQQVPGVDVDQVMGTFLANLARAQNQAQQDDPNVNPAAAAA